MVAPRNVPTHPLSDYGTEMSAGQQFFIGRFEHSISNKPNRLRLHRHTYYEVFWVDGRGSFLADFREYLVAGPWLIFASRGQVHRWNQKPRILEALSRTLALELAPRRVNTVCPGFIDTGKLWKDLPVEEGRPSSGPRRPPICKPHGWDSPATPQRATSMPFKIPTSPARPLSSMAQVR